MSTGRSKKTAPARIDIIELSPEAVKTRLGDKTFSSVGPYKCDQCGSTQGFERHVFRIKGLPKNKYDDNEEQATLRDRFRNSPIFPVENIFFKIFKGDLYVDSAVCQNCKSTRVIFDLSFEDEKMSALAKAVGADPETFKAQVEALAKKIR